MVLSRLTDLVLESGVPHASRSRKTCYQAEALPDIADTTGLYSSMPVSNDILLPRHTSER